MPDVNDKGRLIADFTVTRLGPDHFFLVGSGSAVKFHQRLLQDAAPSDSVTVENLTDGWAGFSASGPLARSFMDSLTEGDLSPEGMAFLTGRETRFAGAPAFVLRVSFTGELGYEVYCPDEGYGRVYRAVREVAEKLGLVFCGSLAQDSLRLEKGYGSVFTEYTSDYTPFEAGLGSFVRLDKGPFTGREALKAAKDAGPQWRLALFRVDSDDADCLGAEPVWKGEKIIGETTSGAFGFHVGKSLALAYITAEEFDPEADYRIPVLGCMRPAAMLEKAPYDPDGTMLRQ